ncbi:cyanophycinase [Fibrella aestuarina BUZ 2]|uniref:Cyanophycinase n=1 Tax=Fibrella aestuarina BUZ 2 TaxID=1166018 RepID=I0KB97_9BACT|nr:cyanophycinase [Fibrella aestuarina]CCH01400.1 cyanophycinase [Fibrella aestuarina BUZ 2]
MKRINIVLVLLLTTLTTLSFAQTTGPEKGALVIVGGGAIPPDIWNRFIELAGGAANARIVVIPTAGDDSTLTATGQRTQKRLQELGVAHVTLLHTRDPKQANQEAFVKPLREATAVWFDGGRHWRLADSYLNTLAHKEFNALLSRGGVIGGTSAGATILGSFMVRGDTKGNSILVGDHTEGLGFVKNLTVDQHVLRRNRQFDLIEVIKARPALLGIGIDESTAVVVRQNTFEVLGNSFVGIYDSQQISSSAKYPSGQNSTGGPFYFLGKGQQFDILNRTVINQPAQRPNEPAK